MVSISMNDAIDRCKEYINTNELDKFKEFGLSLLELEYDWPYFFHRVYLHACLKKRNEFADWLYTLYERMDPIQQIALRQIFPYGRHLLTK